MAEGTAAIGATKLPTDSGRPVQAAFQAAIKHATSNIKGLAQLLVILTTLALAYYAFQEKLKLQQPWPIIICTGFLVIFALLFFIPELRDQMRLKKLRNTGIDGQLENPRYFRLVAFETDETDSFSRTDGATADVCKWIEGSSQPLIYLSGQSGVGKSSLINAAIIPLMTARKWLVLPLRAHDSPLEEITAALLRPSAVWQKPPTAPSALRDLIEQAVDRVRRDGKRLLLVIDQFEEVFILCGDETKRALSSLLCDLAVRPVPGMKIVLSVRAEYLNDLPELELPSPAFGPGQNAFEVRPSHVPPLRPFLRSPGSHLRQDCWTIFSKKRPKSKTCLTGSARSS
jgi:Novel STAND NTPase 1